MEKFNVTAQIDVSIAMWKETPARAKAAVENLLRNAILYVDDNEFVIESADVTGVFDADWNEV